MKRENIILIVIKIKEILVKKKLRHIDDTLKKYLYVNDLWPLLGNKTQLCPF